MTARIVGHGPQRVVVSHGWIAGSALFDAFASHIDVDRFAFAFPEHRGYGARIAEPGPCGIRESADEVLALADELGWSRFSVLGHSMGGMVAQWLMTSASERLTAALLVASVPASGAKLTAEAKRARMLAMESRAGRRELIDANTGHRRDGAWLDALVELSFRTTTTRALGDYQNAFSDTDFAAAAQGASVPTLVLVGALDPGVRAELMRETMLLWYPHASLVELADTGHYPMYEQPAELYREVDGFLSGCTSPR